MSIRNIYGFCLERLFNVCVPTYLLHKVCIFVFQRYYAPDRWTASEFNQNKSAAN